MSVSSVVRFSFSRVCRLHEIRRATINSAQSCWNRSHPPLRSTSPSAAPLSESSPQEAAGPPAPESAVSRESWRVVSAVCVQRMPTLSRDKTALEIKFQELKDQVRVERSKLSDFELEELEYERAKNARIKKAQEENITDAKGQEKSEEFEDLLEFRELEFQEFKPASRLTEADLSGDLKSLDRKLDRVLYLLVKKPREEHAWQMPQGGVEEDESLIQAAEREFIEECGSKMKVNFYSPTPLAVFSYHHPPLPSGQTKSKVFFLKAFYQDGVLQLDRKELVDHMWVTKEEMSDYVSQDYYQAIQPILTE